MSLLMLKTKNLSWQDHTLNIEVMLAPLRSSLLLNKHKTLDTKFDQEKALYERQRDACEKDFVVEKRLIERRRQKIVNRKKELVQEIRSHSAIYSQKRDKSSDEEDNKKERSSSAPIDGRKTNENMTPSLPKLDLKMTPLFGGNFLRPKMFLETGVGSSLNNKQDRKQKFASKDNENTFLTGGGKSIVSLTGFDNRRVTPKSEAEGGMISNKTSHRSSGNKSSKSPKPPRIKSSSDKDINDLQTTLKSNKSNIDRGITKRIPNVTFLGLLDAHGSDLYDDGDDDGKITVEVKQKTLEDKVREFLKDLEAFNSRPPTSIVEDDDSFSVFSSVRSREISAKQPLVANRYHTLTMDRRLLEKAFDRYIEKRSHDDLLKAMKLAAKMKAHIRQARNTSLVPTMATMKSSRTFLKLLKRQQRREKQNQQIVHQ